MRKILSTICLLLFTALPAFANNLTISNVSLEDRNQTNKTVVVQFNISWDHSWRKGDGRRDAVWVFVKLLQNATNPWLHGKMYTAGTNPTNTSPGSNVDLKIVIPTDKIGAFLERTWTNSGTMGSQKVRLTVDYGSAGIANTDTIQAKVFGIEMVYIPEGPFYVGDGTNSNADEVASAVYYGANINNIFISVFNSSETFQWAKRLGASQTASINSFSIDRNNNIVVLPVGPKFDLNGDGDTVDTNETNTVAPYGGNDILLDVFNSVGTYQWSKRLGASQSDTAYYVTTDSSNNIYLVGNVIGNADLNGNGTTSDTNETGNTGVYGNSDIAVSTFNSSGTFIWSKRLGGTSTFDSGLVIEYDRSNKIIVGGHVDGTADLNGNGTTSDTNETGNTGVYAGTDSFISVFDSTGTFQWSKRIGGTSNETSTQVRVDSNYNIVVTGKITGTADLNGNGTTADTNETGDTGVYGGGEGFISVFNSAGTFQWSKRFGGTGSDAVGPETIDSNNNIIVFGQITGNADLNGNGTTSDTNETASGVNGGSDDFISVFNSSGTFQWSKRLGGTGNDLALGVTVDSRNNIIVSGNVDGDADLSGNGTTADSNETGNTGVYGFLDAFISEFDSSGNFQWSKRLGGTFTDRAYDVKTDSSDNIFVVGIVTGNADLNGDALIPATYGLYQFGADDIAAQITTAGASITCDLNSNDDLDTSPITVTGLAGITGNTSWPNGYSAFYAMKYEITQTQYVDFLNTLSRVQQGNRVAATVSGNTIANYYVMTNGTSVTARQGIRAPASGNGTTPTAVVFGNDLSANGTFNETDDGQALAMNYMSWMDLIAYADWAALRPMTELEYEKITNGPTSPNFGQGAWATTTITTVTSVSNGGRSNESAGQTGEGLSNYNSGGAGGPMRAGFAATSATNRKSAGAGYFGNMDMSDNVLERVVTLGRSTGRSFTGTHGDGTVNTTASYEGNATNNDWPGIDGTTNKGVTGASGTGFKGGGYTSSAQYMYTADRTSASVTDSGRGAAYGGRLVRTSP